MHCEREAEVNTRIGEIEVDLWPVEFVSLQTNWEILTVDKMLALGMDFLSGAWKEEILSSL